MRLVNLSSVACYNNTPLRPHAAYKQLMDMQILVGAIVALYALRVEYGHCRIRVDTASGKSWAVDLLNYGMLLGSPAAQQLRNCPAACIHGVAPRSMQVNVKQR